MRYLVTSKNKKYEGKTFGIRFTNGRAVLDEHTLSPHLNRTVEEIAGLFKRDMVGYTIRAIRESHVDEGDGSMDDIVHERKRPPRKVRRYATQKQADELPQHEEAPQA